MRSLRILSGLHAGASIELSQQSLRIGSGGDCDIVLLDWQGASALLQLRSQSVSLQLQGETQEAAPAHAFELREQVAVRAGGIELLLAHAGTAEAGAAKAGKTPASLSYKRPGRAIVLPTCALALLVCAFVIGWPPGHSAAIAALPGEVSEQSIRQVVVGLGLDNLQVSAKDGRIVVHGWVRDGHEDALVRAHIASLTPLPDLRYALASSVSATLKEALRIPGVEVHHEGNGTFVVTGQIASRAELQKAISRVVADSMASVQMLRDETTVVRQEKVQPQFESLLAAGELQFASDGTGIKRLRLTPDAIGKPARPNVVPSTTAAGSPRDDRPARSHPPPPAKGAHKSPLPPDFPG